MKINKLTASFGKLENESLRLHEGLNVICSPNESGKTTWCALIRSMLYGVDSSERARAGYLPDKQRYAPWTGAPMEGSMELSSDRGEITITRRTKSKSAPMREFDARYTGTNTPVEGLNSANAGEQLTGVSKEVFCRSAFIGQGAVAISGNPELEKRIGAIVSTGEEQSSYTEADERLRSWQRKRRYNRKGLLPELEAKMDENQRRLEALKASAEDISRMEERLERAKNNCAQLEQAVTDSRKKQRRDSLERLNSGRAELKESSEAHDAALSRLSIKREELQNSRFGDRNRDEVETQVREDLDTLAHLNTDVKLKAAVATVICFILAVTFAAIYTSAQTLPFIILAALFCVGAVVMLLKYSQQKRAAKENQAIERQILRKYKAAQAEDISAALEDYLALYESCLRAEEEELRCRAAYEQARANQDKLESAALAELDFASGESEAARLGRELTAARAEAESISARIASLNGRLSAMGDPLVLTSSLGCMQEEYEQISNEYDAICLAIETMRAADGEIQSRFAPELGRLAARYMSIMTGGRYEEVFVARDFSARARTGDDVVAREAEYLSAGTLDLMYLAVRLAVCALAMPEGESCPLIIDDALVNFDEQRTKQAMRLLRQIAKERQVILFTCHEVEVPLSD